MPLPWCRGRSGLVMGRCVPTVLPCIDCHHPAQLQGGILLLYLARGRANKQMGWIKNWAARTPASGWWLASLIRGQDHTQIVTADQEKSDTTNLFLLSNQVSNQINYNRILTHIMSSCKCYSYTVIVREFKKCCSLAAVSWCPVR